MHLQSLMVFIISENSIYIIETVYDENFLQEEMSFEFR